MSKPKPCFDNDVICEYEMLRTLCLSTGNLGSLNFNGSSILSDGLFQWALGRQEIRQIINIATKQVSDDAISFAGANDRIEVNVIDLIASMTIQSITQSQKDV